MLSNIPFGNYRANVRKNKEIPPEYKEEFLLQLLHINLERETILAVILLAIDFILLGLDIYATSGWSRNVHVFKPFSTLHTILIIVPSVFLIFIHYGKQVLRTNIKVCRVLHWWIIFSVLILCALISISNENTVRQPYPYIIAMFCIGSAVLLGKRERFFMYVSSYVVYISGCIMVRADMYRFIANMVFSTMLLVLALIVSYIHYSSYVNDFINQKIIFDKNKELSRLYEETEAALQKRTEELNETVEYEKLRVAFFANISHELRTPLTVIFSAGQMLDLIARSDDLQNRKIDVVKYMGIVKQNCYRLIRLVANLIDITKIDAGYFQVSFKNCDIVRVVEDITLSVAKFIEDRDIELTFDTDIEELDIACDPDKIERIILNLLSNAVKFTPKGGRIFVNIHDKDERVEVRIKDTGIGIPENMKQQIFERFIQVDKTTSRNHEGSGIGLSIVKSLIEMHGGTITLDSVEGEGSEFIIELPKRTEEDLKDMLEHNFVGEKQNVEKISIEFSDIYR